MMEWITQHIWACYLGLALGMFTDIRPFGWKWWAIVIPTLLGVAIRGQ